MNLLPPHGCTPQALDWPAQLELPPLQLAACRFDPAQFDAGDYARLGVAPTPGAAKRQMEYLAGRHCAARALAALGAPTEVGRDAERAPQWPSGFCGSISHGDGLALAVAGSALHWRGLGLDLESRLEPARAERLAAELLTAAERERLRDLDEAQRAERITLTFSFKESLFKALFPQTGVRFYFQDAELLRVEAGQADLRLLRGLSPQWPAGSLLHGHWLAFDGRLLSLVAIQA